jgi:hypothetical protein
LFIWIDAKNFKIISILISSSVINHPHVWNWWIEYYNWKSIKWIQSRNNQCKSFKSYFNFQNSISFRYPNRKDCLINQRWMILWIRIYWISNFEVNSIKRFGWISFVELIDLDQHEHMNYRHTILRMLFDRWQHCRQMKNTARNIFNLSTMAETNNESFMHEIYTLIRNTVYQASIVEQNHTMMVQEIELIIERKFWVYFSQLILR